MSYQPVRSLKTAVWAAALALSAQAAFGASTSRVKVLVVLSSEHELVLKGGAKHETGYYLNELSVPAQRLVEAGYDLQFANPKGNTPTLDAQSDNVRFYGGDVAAYQASKAFHASLTGLKHPAKLADIIAGGLEQYAGIFIPGGHAPTIDLMVSPELGQILRYFHQAGKTTGLICHGPLALASAVAAPAAYKEALVTGNADLASAAAGNWPYQGYRLTSFSANEEALAKANLGGELSFNVEDALRLAGAELQEGGAWKSKVVHDRELITGQNPFSDSEFATVLVASLDAARKAK